MSSQPYPYVLFWDWTPSPSYPTSLACFSQWFARDFTDPDPSLPPSTTFKTAEHYMMCHKALLFDPEAAQAILDSPTPEEAKRLGRLIRGFDREVWNGKADGVVERANYLKFSQHEDLKGYVFRTEGKTLVECNRDDRIWGIGYGVEDAKGNEDKWGQNR